MGKENLEVKFSGEEYLDYIKYKDKKRSDFWTKENKIMLFVLSLASLMAITIMVVVDMLTPTVYHATTYTWEGIIMFLVVCVGLGWLFHGVGFILIRR